MLKQILEEAIRKAEIARDQKEREAKERVMRERVLPFNAEIDKSRNEAIAQLQASLDSKINTARQNFEAEKARLIEAGEKKKTENANIVIDAELAAVGAKFNAIIAELNKQLEVIKE